MGPHCRAFLPMCVTPMMWAEDAAQRHMLEFWPETWSEDMGQKYGRRCGLEMWDEDMDWKCNPGMWARDVDQRHDPKLRAAENACVTKPLSLEAFSEPMSTSLEGIFSYLPLKPTILKAAMRPMPPVLKCHDLESFNF
ncbi:hypothetical protein Nepgr_005174 [Nepenthes gracilis]|uniref:Uncharacterized protein n=1 Tax=Nepenthes gracilis TaxID=150966 RepID=A0AAD3S2R8_NEPGR|nr:hypothetical protein Nepgr_005174 [Nepenthes gracilis]